MPSHPSAHRSVTALAAALLAAFLAVCTGYLAPPARAAASAETDTGSGSGGSTLRVAMEGGGIDSLNPFLGIYAASWDVYSAIYPTLTTILPDGEPGPYLATSWKQSADHLSWTFAIKSGLEWSDGAPLTAADIAWTFHLIMTNQTAATENGAWFVNVASVTAPDATTLVIKTVKPEANLLYVSTPFYSTPVVPEHIWQSHVADLGKYRNDTFPVVGYGPWVLTGYTPGQYVKFDADKDFFLGSPHYDHLIEINYTNEDAYVAALKDGQLDYAAGLDPVQFKAVQKSENIKTAQSTGNGWAAIDVNPGARTQSGTPLGDGNPALRDQRVRHAIALAINRQELVQKVIDGQGVAGAGYLPPAFPQWYWTPPANQLQGYDPAEANAILDAAGYNRGADGVRVDPKTGKPLDLRLGIHGDSPDDAATANYLVGWLGAIGIKLGIDSLSMGNVAITSEKGTWDLLMDGWTGAPDPTGLLSIQTCGSLPTNGSPSATTDAFYCNSDFDKLFAEQSTVFDAAQRVKVVDQMQQMIYNADDNIVLYYQTVDIAYSDKVTGLITGKPDARGYYPAQTTFYSYLQAAPVAARGESSGGNAGLWIGLAAVVLVLGAAGFLLVRRRARADDME